MRVVVIGASGGIGREIVRRFAETGAEVHAVGRSKPGLDELALSTGCTPHSVDAADGAAVAALFDGLGPVDVLVYGAGVGGSMAPFHQTEQDHITQSVATNVAGLLYAVHAALPGMVDRGAGHVIVVGSVAGLYPIASATYAATKSAGHAFVQSLRLELHGSGVRVSEVSPGRVNTDFVSRANPDRPLAGPQPDPESLLQAADVADAVLYAATARHGVQVSHIELVPGCQAIGGSRFVTNEEREQD